MIVADANLIAYFAIDGTKTAQARAVNYGGIQTNAPHVAINLETFLAN